MICILERFIFFLDLCLAHSLSKIRIVLLLKGGNPMNCIIKFIYSWRVKLMQHT